MTRRVMAMTMIMISVKSKTVASMKRIFSSVMLVAAAATAFFSCQKQEVIAPETEQEVMLTFASEKPAFDDETRTEWTGETIQWSKGDKISIAYTVEGNWQNASGDAEGNAKLYKSEALTEASLSAEFNVSASFTGTTSGVHVFYGVYPAPASTDISESPVATLTVAPSQTPKADSFDPNGDLMIGVSNELGSRPGNGETISLKWERLVAHAVISLKNIKGLTADEKIENITLTAQDDANLVGQQKVNLITKEVVKDNTTANVLKLGASNLTVNEGILSFWACVLPETITSLTVVVETDKATYTREITGISKTFKQNARNTLAIKMDEAVREEKVVASDEVVDVLNRALTEVEGTSYASWNGKTSISDAVYAGQSAGGNESIQLRSSNSNSGIVTTTSGGFAKKVTVIWNSNTSNGRTLNVYGSNTAYTDPTELYDNTTSGTKLGTIVCGTSTELVIDGDYEYIGLRSNSGAMYISEIQITWSTGPVTPDTTPSVKLGTEELELTSEESEGTIEVNAKNIASIEVRALVEEGSQDESDWLVAEYDDVNSLVTYTAEANESEESRTAYIEVYCLDAAANEIVVGVNVTQKGAPQAITVAEFLALSVGTTEYQLTGVMEGTYNTTYGNFYLNDGTEKILVYGLTATKKTSNDQSFASLGLKDGDTITIIGTRADYDGTAQVGGPAYLVSCEKDAAWDAPAISFANNIVTLVSNEGAAIYYTLDGTTPSESSQKYSEPFEIQETVTVNAIAVKEGRPNSSVAMKECEYVEISDDEVVGGSADFATISDTNTSYASGSTTAGWSYKNCAILKGGTSDSSPAFKMIGDASNRALCMNGKTSAVGSITSPTITTGCGTLAFNYGLPFSDTKIKFRVDIMQNSSVVKTFTIDNASATKLTKYSHSEEINVSGDFQIVFTNLSPSNSTSNKDRTAIWDVEWTGCN